MAKIGDREGAHVAGRTRSSAASPRRTGTSNTLTQSVIPVLGLTRRGDLRTKLRAFDLGVDDIVTSHDTGPAGS